MMHLVDVYQKLFYQSLRIRLVEEKIIEIYPSDKIQSPVHLSIGQEAVAAGVCYNLEKTDLIYSSYRSHAYFLAKGGNLSAMFAELYGKITGCGRGKAGSMHLADKNVGMMGSSAIVASTISHGVGSALAAKRLRTNQVVVTVFGDGATEEGSFHESLNFASVFKLPVIFICENNKLAIHSKLEARQAYNISNLASAYNIKTLKIDEGYDFQKIQEVVCEAIIDARLNSTPYFIEISTYRYKEHVGIGDDHNVDYRSVEEFENWKSKDPLLNDCMLYDKLLPVIKKEIDEAVLFAESSPVSNFSELLKDVY